MILNLTLKSGQLATKASRRRISPSTVAGLGHQRF